MMLRTLSRWPMMVLVSLVLFVPPVQAQTNKPISAYRFVNDGKPYNIIPVHGDKWAKQRACPYWYYKENDTEARLSINATAICHRKGDKTRTLTLNFSQYPQGNSPRREAVLVNLADSAPVLSCFQDVLRIGRSWREGQEPIAPKTISFDAAPHLAVSISKTEDVVGNYPITVRFTSAAYTSRRADTEPPKGTIDVTFWTMEDFSAFISTFDQYRKWLEGL